MNVTAINGIPAISTYNNKVTPADNSNANVSFESLFKSALGMVDETNKLSNDAEEEEIAFAMGKSDSVTDLQAAQQKANLSLQYTVAVRNTVLDSYRELMNLQF